MDYFWKANQEATLQVNKALNLTIGVLKESLATKMLAVLLTGSFSRGEGVWKQRGGKIEILSDLDLLVILKLGAKASPAANEKIKQISENTGINIDLKIRSPFKIKYLPKDTHTFDIPRTARTVYGQDLLDMFPHIRQGDLGTGEIEAIFFNRAILNIEKCSPQDLKSDSDSGLWKLSYLAAKTMFTCTDIMTIHHGCYNPSINERAKLATELSASFAIPQKQFLHDLATACNFVFKRPESFRIEGISSYWSRSRQYLLSLFLLSLGRGNNPQEIFCYPFPVKDDNLPILEKIRLSYKKLKTSHILLKRHKQLKLMWKVHPITSCRMACLMLYMAIAGDKDTEKVYTSKALEYFSNLYPFSNQNCSITGSWIALRNELLQLHSLGVF